MYSLGNVALWQYASSNSKALTGDVGELFLAKVLGIIILKLKYKDVVYAVSKSVSEKNYFIVQTSEGVRYIQYDEFDELKKNIAANNP